jgi:hypothetical protein
MIHRQLPGLLSFALTLATCAASAFAQEQPVEPAAIPAEHFATLHKLIKPQPGELRFHEIPWLIDVWEARKKAAAEGKPILAWSGAGGAPIGVC